MKKQTVKPILQRTKPALQTDETGLRASTVDLQMTKTGLRITTAVNEQLSVVSDKWAREFSGC